jgi:predicted DNA-binding protein with PD1-like motif
VARPRDQRFDGRTKRDFAQSLSAEARCVSAMQLVQDGTRWMLRLDDGQDLFQTLTDFARERKLRAAAVLSGIGMLKAGSVGYWNGQEYETKKLEQPHELVALHGSIAESDGNPSLHLHAALADREHRTVSGHLVNGTIGVLAEIYLETFPKRVFGRPMNESLGLRTLDLEPGSSPPV